MLGAFKRDLRSEMPSEDICDTHIFNSKVWLLEQRFGEQCFDKYDEIKRFFGKNLKTDPNEIAIVGSSKTGFSLTPDKNYRKFDNEKSDIDLVVVSRKLFDIFWEILLQDYHAEGKHVSNQHMTNVFRKFVSFKPFNSKYLSRDIKVWNEELGGIQSEFFTHFSISNNVNYRIYQSWAAVKLYHTKGIIDLRKDI